LHAALDRIAAREGYMAWSLLMAKAAHGLGPEDLYAALEPGDLLLLGARPQQGKTRLSLQLAAQAMDAGNRATFVTLDYTAADVVRLFRGIGRDPARFGDRFVFDGSNDISAGYIVKALAEAAHGTFVVIDYLQLLDQNREIPPLADQVNTLKTLARERGLTIVFISQIDRSYDPDSKPCPDMTDVRLPNPLDLGLFDKSCFLHGGEVRFGANR
jgi:replicative DNA helicase